ncbi:hypothetical protein [Bosea sp. TAF32]|uniref:hypothetical protein n=1 Tax=Bosea sp. TAF32 TaxID=3237482 RepID=UPI003F915770
MLEASIVNRLMLSRFLFNNAMEHARAHNQFAPFLTANLLQDALEIFLLAAAEHVNAKIERRNDFSTYLDRIDEKIAPKALPFRLRLLQLNKIRVNSKHDAIAPDPKEIESLTTVAHEFLREATSMVFGVDYASINLISLIEKDEIKALLTEADTAYQKKDFRETLIACRKALYIMFEKSHDIKKFEDDDTEAWIAGLGSDAPTYARSKQYIQSNVRSPFDYIVLDISKLDNRLLKDRIDPVVFWNIWRLTPSVYQQDNDNWLIKNDLEKFHGAVEQNATYVLENLVEIVLRRQERNKSSRYARDAPRFYLGVKTKNAKVYKKADSQCETFVLLPDDATQVDVSSSVPSLREGEGQFWEITYFKDEAFIMGYMSEDDLDFQPDPPPPETEADLKKLRDALGLPDAK